MKKLFYSNFLSRLLMLLAVVTVSSTAYAEDFGQMKLDTDYTISGAGEYYGTFVAPSTGKLNYADQTLIPYSDAAHTQEISSEWEGYGANGPQRSIQVTEGQTVHFYENFFFAPSYKFRMSMNAPFGVDFRSLEDGAKLNCSGEGTIQIRMTEKPTFSGVKMVCDGQEFDWKAITTVRQEKYLVIGYASTLLGILEANPTLCGKNCQVVISGLAVDGDPSKLYNGDGVLTLNLVVGNIPTKLTSNNILGASICSWFRPAKEDGVFTFTFSNPIKSGSITLSYGNPESETSFYTETTEMTINGNTVSVDLRGKQRRLDVQKDDSGNDLQFSLKLQSFIDENDEYIYTTDQGSLGSISFNLPYKLITTNLTSEFTPANGSLAEANNMEIYFTPATDVLFDGVSINWDGNPAAITIAKGDLTIKTDSYDGCSVTFAVPAAAKTAENVVVTLAGLDTPDGMDYSDKVTAKYNVTGCIVTLVSPVDGSSLAGFVAEESKIKVNVENAPTDAAELEVVARIYDPNAEYPIYTTYLQSATPEDGETDIYNYAQTIYESLDFFSGVDYTINITVTKVTYPAAGGRDEEVVANNNYTIHGTATPFVYSEAALIDINPNPATTDIISTDQNTITLTFDAPVTVTKAGYPLGMGAGIVEWTVAKADTDGKVWTVTIPTSVIEKSKSTIGVSFWVVDAENRPVYKTNVEGLIEPTKNKENTYFNISYVCTVGAPDFVVDPANDSELETLDKIYVSYSGGIDPNWNNTLPITLYKGKGTEQEKIQEWAPGYFDKFNEDICVDYNNEANLKWCIALDEAITEPGYYTFVFPNAFFNLGSEFNQALSNITNVHYIIPDGAGSNVDKVTTVPEAGSSVVSLKVIKITWTEASDASVDWNVTDPVVLLNADNEAVCSGTIDISENWDDPWNMLVVTLDEEVTASGTYTLHIPAGKVLLNDGALAATEQNITFNVGTSISLDAVNDNDSNAIYFDLTGRQVNRPSNGIFIKKDSNGSQKVIRK